MRAEVNIQEKQKTTRLLCVYLLTPGLEYLLAGPEEAGTGRPLVTMQSVVVPWTPRLGPLLSEALSNGCL